MARPDVDVLEGTFWSDAAGNDEQWEIATAALKKGLEIRGLKYEIDPGEGTFYGPKIDIKIKDSLDRAWQCSTIQVDFHNPNRFGLEFIGEDGKPHQPVMIHRALLGSLERFFGVLIEHYGGAFPLWLAPTQAVVIPVTEKHHAYAAEMTERLKKQGVRVTLDDRSEKLGYKIREAQMQKVPYMLVVGDKEVEAGTVSVRHRQAGDLGAMAPEDLGYRSIVVNVSDVAAMAGRPRYALIGLALPAASSFVTHSSLPVFESNARKRRSSVAPTNTSPPAVTVGPALPLPPTFCFPSGRFSLIPSVVCHAIAPVFALTATSLPHGGRWHGALGPTPWPRSLY